MRQLTGSLFRWSFLLGVFSLLGMPAANAQGTPADSQTLLECAGGGSRYAQASTEFAQGRLLAAAGDPQAVDWFYSSALKSWDDLNEGLTQQPPQVLRGSLSLYNSAVLSCVIVGHRLGRLDPAIGLRVSAGETWQTIPVVGVGMVWRLDQIDCFGTAQTCFEKPEFNRSITYGVGASMLGIHRRRTDIPGEKLFSKNHALAITAVLRRGASPENAHLELYDPVHRQTVEIAGRELRLSSNIAGAVSFGMSQLQTNVNPWSAFFNPEIAVEHEGLLLLQPHQPGKIPVVLVHGLLSNPATWGTMLNEFFNNPELMERFQLWAYLYPTSVPFVQTASEFRKDLRETLEFLDPGQQDPALQDMVLVGHSMGGLLSRLQVTWSGNLMWDEFSKVPFAQIRGDAELKQTLAEIFFFEPQPFVKRVVFMATPHRGSGASSRFFGCLGRLLAGRLEGLQAQWEQLQRLNPFALRAPATGEIPSSVASLNPNSPALQGLAKLPFSSCVHLHSIIGTGGCKPCFPGDGVVAVESARLMGVESEFFVKATHTGVKENPDSIREVERILWLHWAEYERERAAHDDTPAIPAPAPSIGIPEAIPAPSPAE